jgi:hypothetical protein
MGVGWVGRSEVVARYLRDVKAGEMRGVRGKAGEETEKEGILGVVHACIEGHPKERGFISTYFLRKWF